MLWLYILRGNLQPLLLLPGPLLFLLNFVLAVFCMFSVYVACSGCFCFVLSICISAVCCVECGKGCVCVCTHARTRVCVNTCVFRYCFCSFLPIGQSIRVDRCWLIIFNSWHTIASLIAAGDVPCFSLRPLLRLLLQMFLFSPVRFPYSICHMFTSQSIYFSLYWRLAFSPKLMVLLYILRGGGLP